MPGLFEVIGEPINRLVKLIGQPFLVNSSRAHAIFVSVCVDGLPTPFLVRSRIAASVAECRKWCGAPRPMEGQALQWARPSQLSKFDMPAADVPLLPAVRAAIAALEASQPVRRPSWVTLQSRGTG